MADEWYKVNGVDTRKFSPTPKRVKRRKQLGTAMRNKGFEKELDKVIRRGNAS